MYIELHPSVPLYILVMCLADYLFHPCGVITYVNVKANIGFVIRNTLTEHMNRLPDCRLYKKVFIFFWAMPISVVVMAYAGNLTAMITRDHIQYKHIVLFCSGLRVARVTHMFATENYQILN